MEHFSGLRDPTYLTLILVPIDATPIGLKSRRWQAKQSQEKSTDIRREQNADELVWRLGKSLGRWDVPRAFSGVVLPMGQR